MKTTLKSLLIGLISSYLTACSLMPYENEFSCNLKDSYGKCINVSSAYEEAVTGVERHPPMKKYSEQDHDDAPSTPPPSNKGMHDRHDDWSWIHQEPESKEVKALSAPVASGYDGYRSALYRKLQGLVDQPTTPMIKPPRAVRTMILPYSSQLDKRRLYMPRYVYNIVEEPSFVLGEYLYKRPELTESLMEKAN